MKMRMRKTSRMYLCLLMVAMLVAVAVPMNVSADAKYVPFKGDLDGSTVPRVDPDLERIEVSGKASHLGKYTAVVEFADDDIILDWSTYNPSTGTIYATLSTMATFTAANGDELYADITLEGMFSLIAGNYPSFALSGTITDGTGHFDGASGSFTGSGGQTTVEGDDNDLISGSFSGTISTVGSS
ncbi:MAG: hypothetical protein JSW25_05780 [Thermoplasmata archaeon]|nr:MAG: hypothetical protein JSW25_05780 [Thermoplasmata archaeon]